MPTRERVSATSCPKCGANLRIVEEGIMVAEFTEPVQWKEASRYCPRGCLLTVEDFPAE